MNGQSASSSRLRRVVRWTLRIFAGILLILLLGFLFVCRGAIYHRFVTFPREARAWESIRAQRVEPSLDDGWNEYRGVCHSHSELSHDCDVPFPEILAALKETGRDFICMSDHCDNGKADFSRQWRGTRDGIVFVPGYEMSGGFMPWNLPETTVLDCGEELPVLAQQIADAGGMLFFAHTEEDRLWDLPQLTGMEIYNIHTDFKSTGYAAILPDILFSLNKYPDHVLRSVFHIQTKILQRWDDLNISRKIVGIAANDCHQNNGFIGTYTENGTLLVRDTSPDTVGEFKLNFLTRLLARMAFGPLEPGRQLFHLQLDPYPRMVRFVSTHILAHELSDTAVLDALRQGRVFVGFDMLADTDGFIYFAEADGQKAVMGETLPFTSGLHLRGASPLPCRFTILRHGIPVFQKEGRDFDWQPSEAGKYRVEAELDILGVWTPWVYTNPLELK
jgi:hypothetical protein